MSLGESSKSCDHCRSRSLGVAGPPTPHPSIAQGTWLPTVRFRNRVHMRFKNDRATGSATQPPENVVPTRSNLRELDLKTEPVKYSR